MGKQLAVSNFTRYPEFGGTVASVETRQFVRMPKPASPGNQIYHWNNNCESYWLIGREMAKAMLQLIKSNNDKNKGSSSTETTAKMDDSKIRAANDNNDSTQLIMH